MKKPANANKAIKKINNNGVITCNKFDIANTFNIYFSQIGKNLAKNIIDSDEYTMKNNVVDQSIFLRPTDELKVCIIIKLLKKNSPGMNEIASIDLKSGALIITPILIKLVNKCLSDDVGWL